MSNNKQSSIDWLMQQAEAWNIDTRDGSHYITFPKTSFEQAKAMHKEEHRKTWDECLLSSNPEKTFEDHYNETFSDESNN